MSDLGASQGRSAMNKLRAQTIYIKKGENT